MVTDTRPGKAKIHSTVPLSTPRIGGCSGAGAMRKCALTMARNCVGPSRPLDERGGGVRRHREHDGIIAAERDRLAAELERLDTAGAEAHGAQLVLHPHRHAVLFEPGERRLDQGRAQAFARDQRPAGAAAHRQGFADDGAGEPRRALRRFDIERGEEKRLDQPLVGDALAGEDLADGFAGRREQQPRQRQIIAHARAGHALAPDRKPRTGTGRH